MKEYTKPQVKVAVVLLDSSMLAGSIGVHNEETDKDQRAKVFIPCLEDDAFEE